MPSGFRGGGCEALAGAGATCRARVHFLVSLRSVGVARVAVGAVGGVVLGRSVFVPAVGRAATAVRGCRVLVGGVVGVCVGGAVPEGVRW